MKKGMFTLGGLLVLVVLLGAGCGTAPVVNPVPTDTAPAAGSAMEKKVEANTVLIQDFTYAPAKLTVKKGTTVTWTNKDSAKHTITGKNGGPKSELFGQDQSYSYTFDTEGIFDYFCEPHPYMKASVEVVK